MRLKRICSVLLVTSMVATSLIGCSKSDNDDEKTTTAAGESANGETTVGETKDVSLTVWSPAEDQAKDKGEWLTKMCDQFNEAHPEWNITFTYGTCSEGDAGKTVTQDPAASADVYMFANDQLQSLIDANAISELGGTTAEYVQSTNSEAIVNSVTVDGGIYGVPFTTNTWYMFYDKSVFTDDDVKNLDKMLEKGTVAFPLSNSWYVASFYVANGCTMFGADGTDNEAGIDFSGDKATAATEYLVNLVANKNFKNDTDGAGLSGLRDGSIKAIFTGSWDYTSAKEALGDNLGIVSLPTVTIDGADKQLMSFAGSKAIGVNPNCENPEVAVALALYLGSEEAQQAHYETRSIVPCNTKLLEEDAVKSDALVTAQNDTFNNTSIIQPFVAGMGNYWTPADNWGKSLVAGDITLDNAADKTEEFNTSINSSLVE